MASQRAPYKYGEDDLTENQRIYVAPVQEPDEKASIVYKESQIVKPLQEGHGLQEDEIPIFVFSNAHPQRADGTIANILTAFNAGQEFKITGIVNVDEDSKHRLVTYRKKGYPNLNGYTAELSKPTIAAIGSDPDTIWLHSDGGWFEIRPSEKYRVQYEKHLLALKCYFKAIEEYEKSSGEFKTAKEELIHLFVMVAQHDGSGVTLPEIITACRESKDFLVEQFQKKHKSEYYVAGNENKKWIDCNAYKWLAAGCPTDVPDELPIDAAMANVSPPAAGTRPVDQSFGPKPKAKSPKPRTTTKKTMNESESQGPLHIPRAHHGDYISPQYPNGVQQGFDMKNIIAATVCHFAAGKRPGRSDMTIDGMRYTDVKQSVYSDWNVDGRNKPSYEVVQFWAKDVHDRLLELEPSWANKPLLKELAKVKGKLYDGLGHADARKVQRYTVGGEVVKHRVKTSRDPTGKRKNSNEPASRPDTPTNGSGRNPHQSNGKRKRNASAENKLPNKRIRNKTIISGPGPHVVKDKAFVDHLATVITAKVSGQYRSPDGFSEQQIQVLREENRALAQAKNQLEDQIEQLTQQLEDSLRRPIPKRIKRSEYLSGASY